MGTVFFGLKMLEIPIEMDDDWGYPTGAPWKHEVVLKHPSLHWCLEMGLVPIRMVL